MVPGLPLGEEGAAGCRSTLVTSGTKAERPLGSGTRTEPPKGSHMAPRQPSTSPSLCDHLDAAERAAVLRALLKERPELHAEVERLAATLLQDVTTDAVTGDVSWALDGLALEDLAGRAGRQPGRGYVHEGEAAYELVEEAVQPFVDDLRRRARLGMHDAAAQLAVRLLAGLYECRDAPDGSVLAYAGPDTPGELAAWVMREAAEAQVDLPAAAVEAACPDWA